MANVINAAVKLFSTGVGIGVVQNANNARENTHESMPTLQIPDRS